MRGALNDFMTIIKLNKLLTALIAQGHGRKKVNIDKSSFTHPLESDGCVILPVEELEVIRYGLSDDDGGTKCRQDGTECSESSLVLFGGDRRRDES